MPTARTEHKPAQEEPAPSPEPDPPPNARTFAPWITREAWAIDPTWAKELAARRETLVSMTCSGPSKPPPWWRYKGAERATGPRMAASGVYGAVPFGALHLLNPRALEDEDIGPATAEAVRWS